MDKILANKKLIGWILGVLIVGAGGYLGVSKEDICGCKCPVVEQVKPSAAEVK